VLWICLFFLTSIDCMNIYWCKNVYAAIINVHFVGGFHLVCR
jgi:hypothetical protein